jgi:hypothetical protein
MTTIDFARALQEARGASMEALPVGDYDVEVAKSEATTSSNGKPMIKVNMKVIGGPYERRSVLNQFVMSQENPVALSIFFRHMKAFGLTEDWFMQLGRSGSLEPVATALLGRRARLTLGHRDWQGETRNEVKAVKPYTGAPAASPAGPVGPAGSSGPATGGLMAPPPVAPAPQPVPPQPPTAPVAATPLTPPPAASVAPQQPAPAPVMTTPQPPIEPTAAPVVAAVVPTAAPTGSTSVDGTSAPSAPNDATFEQLTQPQQQQPQPQPPAAPDMPQLPF